MKAAKAIEKQVQKALKEAAKQEKEEQLRLQRVDREPSQARRTGKKKERRPMDTIIEEEVEKEVRITSHRRLVHRPKHLTN